MLIIDRAAVIGIYLAPMPQETVRVGSLVRDASGVVTFTVDDNYLAMGPQRPVLSMAWRGADEEDTIRRLVGREDKVMRSGLLPPYFSGLLPEGALRELVEAEFGTGAFDDFDVLARLGSDLPGAVVARLEAGQAGAGRAVPAGESGRKLPVPPGGVKFSLAGIQLKFAALASGHGVTVPGRDQHGDIILKVPSERHQALVEAEYTGLELARAVGVRTAEAFLVDTCDVHGIPSEYLKGGTHALAVRRFDRAPGGRRVHTEDYAQILGAIGDRKYTMANEETVYNVTRRFSGDWSGELLEAVRRTVVNVMLGNGDAHLKNWSLLHVPGGVPELTPAYDIVPTVLYGDTTMALAFGGTRDAARITLRKFERAAGLVKVSPDLLAREAKRTVEAALDIWPSVLGDLPLPQEMRQRIVDRWRDLALVKEARPTLAPGIGIASAPREAEDTAPTPGPRRP
ncbi:MAG: type II toxin-antitoxin system HipA family toxin [Bacteroidota bacterium]